MYILYRKPGPFGTLPSAVDFPVGAWEASVDLSSLILATFPGFPDDIVSELLPEAEAAAVVMENIMFVTHIVRQLIYSCYTNKAQVYHGQHLVMLVQ